jgi:hypothetical protein
MERRKGCIQWTAVALCSLVGLALLALCPLGLLYNRRLDQARATYAAPTVYVTQPASGSSSPAGSQLAVSATAWGDIPISRAELWLDGQLLDTQESDLPAGISPFYAHFSLLVAEGPQQLFVRAVNLQGIVGQSVPIGVSGQSAVDEGLAAVVVSPAQTLGDIAAANDTEPEVLRELNPGLGDEEPFPGTEVIVPSASSAPPAIGPAVPPSPGMQPVTGTVPITPGIGAGQPLQPSPGMTNTITLPAIIISDLPKLAFPAFTPPVAPTALSGAVRNCMVRLSWQDNASDELQYDVWMAPLAGAPQLIASLTPAKGGAVWYEFPPPRTGGLSFWVEAVNGVGKQPSDIIWIEVDPKCPTRSPASLAVEALDMTLRGNHDRVYCYVSLENTPDKRLPSDDSAFIQVTAGRGDIAAWASGNRKFLVPIPADGALDLSGECWGWSGDDVINLGGFGDSINSSQWTGTRLSLPAKGYEIGYTVTYAEEAGRPGEETTYAYEDPTLPAPYNLGLLSKAMGGISGSTWTSLHWEWNGNQSELTGFAVFLDGQPYITVWGGDKRGIGVQPLTECGKRQQWQVAAVAGERQSSLSAVYEYRTPECPVTVEVIFEQIEVSCVDTNWFHPACPSCDTVECWFRVFANDQSALRFNKQFRLKLSCQTWNINWAEWFEPRKNTLTVQLSPSDTSLTFGSGWFYINDWGELAKFQQDSRTITMTLDQWKTYQGEHRLCTKQAGVMSCLVVKIRGPNVSVL